MKREEWNEGLNHLDPDLIEKFVVQKEKLQQKKIATGKWRRWRVLAACFALIVSAVIVVLALQDPGSHSMIHPPQQDAPSDSTVKKGSPLTGKQALVYGALSPEEEGDACIIPPGFEIQTVIEAEVIEVLPDTYYHASSFSESFHIAKLRVVDQIRGEGFPEEIYLCYPYYDVNVFDGYERFIMSLKQTGMENYVLVNGTQSRMDYFPNMFEVCMGDLGYGSVIAFRDGRVDDRFWEKNDSLVSKIFNGKEMFQNMINAPRLHYYPASRNTAIARVKSNIIALAKEEENWHVSPNRYDYVTADDVFVSEEARAIRTYLEPTKTNVFVYSLTLMEERVIAHYTRVINGFYTDETVCINGYGRENGNVTRSETVYTEDSLEKIPNIGEALANMNLSELDPPHIKIAEGMQFSNAKASGVYRNVCGKIYGVIRVLWYYRSPDIENAYQKDDMYYLYDETGNCSTVEREALKEILGDDSFIQSFSYDSIIAWD